MSDWQTGTRGGEAVEWRRCDCDEWDGKPQGITAGTEHMREKVANTKVEVCYYVNDATRVITVLRIRTMP